MQREHTIEALPGDALAAHREMMTRHLPEIEIALADPALGALSILLPGAPYDHSDWRRALAGDLARRYVPVRVNIVGGGDRAALDATLAYLRDAPGVTGQYIALHE